MDSEGSVESLNWFIEGEGGEEDMDLGLISVNGNSNFMNGNGAPSSAKKRSKSGRSKTTRIQGSESPTFSEDNSSGLRHRSKKSAVAREHKTGVKTEKSSSSNNSHSSSADAALLLENNNTFFDTMKTSQSRLSRSLSNNRGNSGGAALSQKSLQQLGADQSSTLNASSGDESCSGRSEAAMVAEQKFKDKNREHARNTRSRKKLYIETLKQAFAELSAERKQIEKKKLDTAAQLEQRSVARKQALRTMFFYRATGELSREKWEAILEPEFKLLLPVTPYRSFPPEEVINGQRHVDGIDAMIRDIASLRVMVQSIGSHQREDTEVRVRYYSGLDDTVMSGDSFMCRWILRTENAVECGACHECFKQGMVHAKFSPNHKLIRLELSYDVMCFMQQLRRASGKRYFEVVPNTVASAVEDCDDPNDDSARIITLASPPYTIVKVSRVCALHSSFCLQAFFTKYSLY